MGDFIEVTAAGCHEWRGSRFLTGYGRIKLDGRTYRAHRVAWEMAHGPVPDGMLVLHRCDNPPCVRVDHLFLGTHEDNMADMAGKGRASRNLTRSYVAGGEHHNAKLTNEQVVQVRELYEAGGTSQAALAAQFGVSQALVSKIVRGMHRG